MRSSQRRTDADPTPGLHGTPEQASNDTPAATDETAWATADSGPPDTPAGDPETEIAAAAKALFFARDLLRPGPGPLPFGAKARERRQRRRDVDTVAAARRAELAKLLTASRPTPTASTGRSVGGARPRMVAIPLIAVVIVVVVLGWWMSTSTSPNTRQGLADTGAPATDPPGTGSVWTINPGTTEPVPEKIPPPADLTSPDGAAASWLAAWCPFDPTADPDTVTQAVRAVMTPAGWEQFSATPGQLITDLVPGGTVSCDNPDARVVSRPPGDATSVTVLVSATRTITDINGTREYRIERRQFVDRGDGGLWRVDTAAVGG